MDLAFTGKMLLFKSLNIKSTEIYSDFRPVPADLTFAQGAQLLKQQQAAVARNQAPQSNWQIAAIHLLLYSIATVESLFPHGELFDQILANLGSPFRVRRSP